MRRRNLRYVLLAILFMILAWPSYAAYRNYNGYCSEIGRSLTDRELIDAAILNTIRFSNSKQPTEIYYNGNSKPAPEKEYTVIHYASIEGFRRANPDCCRIRGYMGDGPPYPVEFMNRIFGTERTWVTVRWKMRFIYPDGRREDKEKANYKYLNNCGTVVEG